MYQNIFPAFLIFWIQAFMLFLFYFALAVTRSLNYAHTSVHPSIFVQHCSACAWPMYLIYCLKRYHGDLCQFFGPLYVYLLFAVARASVSYKHISLFFVFAFMFGLIKLRFFGGFLFLYSSFLIKLKSTYI